MHKLDALMVLLIPLSGWVAWCGGRGRQGDGFLAAGPPVGPNRQQAVEEICPGAGEQSGRYARGISTLGRALHQAYTTAIEKREQKSTNKVLVCLSTSFGISSNPNNTLIDFKK